jgi:hypothetical protein
MRRFEHPFAAIDGGTSGTGLVVARPFSSEWSAGVVSGRFGRSVGDIDEMGLQTVSRVWVGRSGDGEDAGRVVLFQTVKAGVAQRHESVRVRR